MAFEMISSKEAAEVSIKKFEEDDSVDQYLKIIDAEIKKACQKGETGCSISKSLLINGKEYKLSDFDEITWGKYRDTVLKPFGEIADTLQNKLFYFGYSLEGLKSDSYDRFFITWER